MNIHGHGCLLYKVDIKRCYRWIPIAQKDYHLIGIWWNNKLYFDTKMPFGLRTGALAAQRTINALLQIDRQQGYDAINYIDDMGSAESPDTAFAAYTALVQLSNNLGLPVADNKCSLPSTNMVFLGKKFDLVSFTVSIPAAKLAEIKVLLQEFFNRKTCTRKQMESLIGKLCFIADCIRAARLFISRLLEKLRKVGQPRHHINLNSDAKMDILWFFKIYGEIQ